VKSPASYSQPNLYESSSTSVTEKVSGLDGAVWRTVSSVNDVFRSCDSSACEEMFRMRRKMQSPQKEERRRSRRGQFEHVFTFIMMAVLAATVLFVGYFLLSTVFDQSCEIERFRFVEDLGDLVKEHKDYGSVKTAIIYAPCETERLCLIDPSRFGPAVGGVYLPNVNPGIPPGAVPSASVAVPLRGQRPPHVVSSQLPAAVSAS